jgi:hypothetical protein
MTFFGPGNGAPSRYRAVFRGSAPDARCLSRVSFSRRETLRGCSLPIYDSVTGIVSVSPGRDCKVHAAYQLPSGVLAACFQRHESFGGLRRAIQLHASVMQLTQRPHVDGHRGLDWPTQTPESRREQRDCRILAWPCLKTVFQRTSLRGDVASARVIPRPPNGE